MPRPKKSERPQGNAIVASAARITTRSPRNQARATGGNWQAEAWDMLDSVGELEFFRRYRANALSMVRLYVNETYTEDGVEKDREVTEGLPAQALAELFGGEAGQSQMMASFGGLLAIPGEAWVVGLLEPSTDPDGPDQWRVLSKDEVTQQAGKFQIDRGDGVVESYADGTRDDVDAEVLALRVWDPHPRKGVEATSSVRAALPILRELHGLTQHVGATIDSRLAGAGILVVPKEASFDAPAGLDDNAYDPSVDHLTAVLAEAMLTAIRDRGNASAVTPLILRVPAQYVKDVQHITFSTPFDERSRELREEALTRLANSLDVPPEVLTGMADVNHWTGWLLDENAIKMHVTPAVRIVVHALTTKFLWPVLQGDADTLDPSLRRFSIRGDTSELRQRPNRATEAAMGHDKLALTDAAWARESGFEDSDLLSPESDEYKRRILMQLARGANPVIAAAALEALGIILNLPAAPAVPGGPPTVAVDAPAAPPAVEQRQPPTQETTGQTVALTLGAETVVLRAVERARNKAGRRRGGVHAVAEDRLDEALTGAWDYLPRVAALCGVDHDLLRRTLDGYARSLLTTGSDHDPVAFRHVVERVLAGG